MNHQNTIRKIPRHDPARPLLVAVSGGSDSIGLLHWLMDNHSELQLHVVTVDHGLREDAATEAMAVKQHCAKLGLAHTTVTWEASGSASSAAAREARYHLLARTADESNAPTIALGHTLDDQAETLIMRALRMTPHSGTRGLSGMSEWATFDKVRLWRPLLNVRREQLRKKLQSLSVSWIDDPTNENTSYERVRVRTVLARCPDELPSSDNLARLAHLSGRTRHWINRLVGSHIESDVRLISNNHAEYAPKDETSDTLMKEVLIWLILICGGLSHRSPVEKIKHFCAVAKNDGRKTMTLGRCLLQTRDGKISVKRENRNRPPLPQRVDEPVVHDGRLLLTPASQGSSHLTTPYIAALEHFRPQEDDCVYETVLDLLAKATRSA